MSRKRRKNTHLLDRIDGKMIGTYIRFTRNGDVEFWWGPPESRYGEHITISKKSAQRLIYILAERFPLDGLAAT